MSTFYIRRFSVAAVLVVSWYGSIRTPLVSAAPAGQYTYTAGGVTVVDAKTGLTWQRTVPTAMTQLEAKTYCKSDAVATSLSGVGWRLPTTKELQTLVDYSADAAPMIDRSAFPLTPPNPFWSSSPVATTVLANVWATTFANGFTFITDPTNVQYVRCVR
jgi:hypothetical protein